MKKDHPKRENKQPPHLLSNNLPKKRTTRNSKHFSHGKTAQENRSILNNLKETVPILLSDMKKAVSNTRFRKKEKSPLNSNKKNPAGSDLAQNIKNSLPNDASLKVQIPPSEMNFEDHQKYLSEGDFALTKEDSPKDSNPPRKTELPSKQKTIRERALHLNQTTKNRKGIDKDSFSRSFEDTTKEDEKEGQAKPQAKIRKSLYKEHTHENTFFKKTLLFTAALIGIFLVWGFGKMAFTSKKLQLANVSEKQHTVSTLETAQDPAFLDIESNLSRSYTLAEQFLQASSKEDILAIAREPERIRPLLDKYYQNLPVDFSNLTLNKEKYEIATFQSGIATLLDTITEDGDTKLLCITNSSTDSPKVDWESFVNYSETPWEKLKVLRPKEPTLMRVKLKEAHYFNYRYEEEANACYRLSDLKEQHFLYVYTKRDGLTHKTIESQIKNQSKGLPKTTSAIVRIYFEKGSGKNQARLDSLINFGTVLR